MNTKSNVIHATTESFDRDVIRSEVPAVVDFYADWCGPCRMLAPHLEKIADEFEGKVKVVKVNVDEEGDLANRHGISGIPTLIFFKGGREQARLVGVNQKQTIVSKINELLS